MNNMNGNIKYLVTGAAGFLGGTICRQLIERGDAVRAFVLKNDPAMKFVPDAAEICEGDLTDMDSLSRLLQPDRDERERGWHDEHHRPVPHAPRVQKAGVREQHRRDPGAPQGTAHPGGGSLRRQRAARLLQPVQGAGDPGGAGRRARARPERLCRPSQRHHGAGGLRRGRDHLHHDQDHHVRDLADGTIRAAERGRSGECYILGNSEVRFKDFARMIAEEAGTKPMRMFLPLGMASLMGKMMEKQARRKGTKPLMTSFSVYNLARNNCFDSTKAMRELGYRTRSYQETMHDEIQWLIETGKVKMPAVKAAVMEPVPAHA